MYKKVQSINHNDDKTKHKHTSFIGWIKGFLYLLTGECIEELFEQLIEEGIVQGVAVIFSYTIVNVIVVFVSVQGAKTIAKWLAKIIIILVKPIIKKYTFKEGTDKLDKLKEFFQKIGDEFATNKKSDSGIAILSGVFSALALFMQYLLAMHLPLWASILIAVLVCLSLFVFFVYLLVYYVHEKPIPKTERIAQKEHNKIVKEAEHKTKALEREQKKITAEAKKRAKEEDKKQEQAERDRLILEEMNKLKAQEEQQQSQQ